MLKDKVYINIITPFDYPTFQRQYSEKLGLVDFLFYENSQEDITWDMVVVYEGLNKLLTIKSKEGGMVFISGEPPMSRKYSTFFLKQFDHLITSHTNLKHPNNHLSQQALPWHYGLSFSTKQFNCNWDELSKMLPPVKVKKIAMITSNKKMMPGHKQRMVFLDALKSKYGDRIDYFGQGINPVDDKAEALLPYKFAICIENSAINNYWTEKISDPYLAYTIPVYYGCTNIASYFNSESIINIDINKVEDSLLIIGNILDNDDSIYEQKLKVLKIERNKVLNDYNLFNVLVKFYKDNIKTSREKDLLLTIKPNDNYYDYKIKMYLLRLKRYLLRYKNYR